MRKACHFQNCHQPFFLVFSSVGGKALGNFSSYNFDIDKNINTIIKTISHSPKERLIIINFSYAGTLGLSSGLSHIVGIYLIAYPIIEPNNPPIAKTSDNLCFLVKFIMIRLKMVVTIKKIDNKSILPHLRNCHQPSLGTLRCVLLPLVLLEHDDMAFAWHDVSLQFCIKCCFFLGCVRTLDFRTTPGMMICFVSTSHISPLHYCTFLAACSKYFMVQSGRSKRRVPG